MDDIYENLGIILLIVISVVAQVTKTAKKAAKSKGTPSVDINEPAYEEMTGKEIRRPNVKVQRAKSKTAATNHKKIEKPFEIGTKSNTKQHLADETNSIKSESGNTKPAVSIDDFDLRTAVIYSEIMTPKFKEE